MKHCFLLASCAHMSTDPRSCRGGRCPSQQMVQQRSSSTQNRSRSVDQWASFSFSRRS
jgi:hypothetical protein